jgi:hypothetical protein
MTSDPNASKLGKRRPRLLGRRLAPLVAGILLLLAPSGLAVASKEGKSHPRPSRATVPTPRLRWSPPGYDGSGDPRNPANYPGYSVITVSGGPTYLSLDDTKDYFIKLGTITGSSRPDGSGRTYMLGIAGGRNVVVIGGAITFNASNPYDDAVGIVVDDGDPQGTVHLEGINIVAPNGITLRTKRTIQIENVRAYVRAYHDDLTDIHPDLVQTWDRGPVKAVRINRFTGYSSFTTFSVLATGAADTPRDWEMHAVDIHPVSPLNGGKPEGANVWMGDPAVTNWHGTNLWYEPGWNGNTRGNLGDVTRQFGAQYSPSSAAFEVYDAKKRRVYTSPLNPGIGAGPRRKGVGARQGDTIRYSRMPLLRNLVWHALIAPRSVGADRNGNFVPSNSVGPGYVSPGYLGVRG